MRRFQKKGGTQIQRPQCRWGSDQGGDSEEGETGCTGRVETANNWALLEQSILVVTNLGWRRGTAEREGCSSSAGRLLGAEGGRQCQ